MDKILKLVPRKRNGDLSFVRRRRGGGFDYWAVQPTGNYSHDCALGKALGEEYLAYIGRNPTIGKETLLACIVQSMIEHAQAGQDSKGVRVGFLGTVNGHAMALHFYDQ